MSIAFGVFLALHGLIHLLGAAKAFGLAELPQLMQPISPLRGGLWLTAALLFMGAAIAFWVWPRWWWAIGAVAVAISMAAIVPSWTDAWFGAIANLIVLAGVIVGFLVQGPFSLRATFESEVERRLEDARSVRPVDESDLAALPTPVQRYLRVAGVVGQPRVSSFRARMHGRIRSGPDARWMPFRAEQYNFFGRERARLFYMTGTMTGIPFHGLHDYLGSSAAMRIKIGGLVTVSEAAGPEMTRAETVTLFNDMCVIAPATLIDPAIKWQPVDDRAVRATFTNAGYTIGAELQFNDAGELVNFWSDDRLATVDGEMKPMRWSTPLRDYRTFGSVRLAARGEGRWLAPEGEYTYIDLEIDEVRYNPTSQ